MASTYHSNLTSHPFSNYFATWAATVPMVGLAILTLSANGTVLVMFAVRPSLRRGKNAYIASLAMADFLVGCCMPVEMLEEVGLLVMGPGVGCRVYLTLRYSLLYVSLLSVLFITLDRWWSIRCPFSYRQRHTRRLAAYVISCVWALSIALYALPIFLWDQPSPPPHDPETDGKIKLGGLRAERGESSAAASVSDVQQAKLAASTMYDASAETGSDVWETSHGCDVPYALSFTWAASTCVLMYLLPLVCMWVINCSLYTKIRQRRSVEIRLTTSVTDTFFVTVKTNKPAIEITEAPSINAPPSDIASPASPLISPSPSFTRQPGLGNNLYPEYGAGANRGRRHSCASVSLSPSPQLDVRRQLQQRRISLPDWALRGNLNMSSSLSGSTSDCRYVGRKWSGCGAGSTGAGGLGLNSASGVLGSGGVYSNSGRPGGDDLVHELLVKQDQKAACCLGLLLAACTLCWLPFAFVTLVRARCPTCVTHVAYTLCCWLLLANSAINPFLYGLLNAQFRNILKQWFYLGSSRRYRPRDTYIYQGVQKQDGPESVRETSNVCLSAKVP